MITHLVSEGVLSYSVLCGVFTTHLLLSFKSNIIDPVSNKLLPKHIFDHNYHDSRENLESMSHVKSMVDYHKEKNNVNWKLFLRDFVIWLITVCILYILWKLISKKIKMPEQKIIL
jgi:large-conductance mechanosensitive channel